MKNLAHDKNINIPVYVINLSERKDRLLNIQREFLDKNEFRVTVVEACRDPVGAVGLWQSIIKIINIAIVKEEDVIIICEDDHEFNEHYSREYFFKCLSDAFDRGVNVLLGGVSGLNQAIPLTRHLFWIDSFFGTQFVVLNSNLFKRILDEPFDERDTADGKLSELTSHKMVMYPFISVQKDFGYSDVFPYEYRDPSYLHDRFTATSDKLKTISDACEIYCKGRLKI